MSEDVKLGPPTHYNIEYLFEKYEPLRKSLWIKFLNRMDNEQDREDLRSKIDSTFVELVQEYNANYGVDFPYYIDKMLKLRIYHYIDRYQKYVNNEFMTAEDEEIVVEDFSTADILERIELFASIDPTISLGTKHRQLLENTVIHKMTLQEQAIAEGVDVDRINARMYFLIKKFRELHERFLKEEGYNPYL